MTSHVFSPPPAVVNFSCYASSEWANHFLLAANRFPKYVGFSPVPYFLHCHSLELGLKAFLLLKGQPKNTLRRQFGHNLVALLAAARRSGLDTYERISSADEQIVQSVNAFYDIPGNKRLQYIDVAWALQGFTGLPPLSDLAALVKRVVRNRQLGKLYLEA